MPYGELIEQIHSICFDYVYASVGERAKPGRVQLFESPFHPISALLSGNFLQNTQPDSYPPYSQRPIKKTGGVQHNDSIDNATATAKRKARASSQQPANGAKP